MKCFAILLAEFFRHAYFRAMLILRYHSFRKCLFSSHAYFQERAYYRENTVRNFRRLSFVEILPPMISLNIIFYNFSCLVWCLFCICMFTSAAAVLFAEAFFRRNKAIFVNCKGGFYLSKKTATAKIDVD